MAQILAELEVASGPSSVPFGSLHFTLGGKVPSSSLQMKITLSFGSAEIDAGVTRRVEHSPVTA